jgi:serine/threonine-protein kinase
MICMADTLIGRVLAERYRLVEVLSDAGPRGVLYRAEHSKLDRNFVVKVFHQPAPPAFEEHARKLSCIRHPNVEAIHDYGHLDDGRPYLVTEQMSGESLAERMSRPIDQLEVLALLRDACAGLAAVHAADLVHGCIKPENVFFESHPRGEQLKLIDFDVPSQRASHGFIDEHTLASADWISPEQAKGLPPEPASDLYSLGAVAYACLAGHPPHTGEPHVVLSKRRDQDAIPLGELPIPAEVDEEVDALIGWMLARDALDRPTGAAAVTERAEELEAELTMPPTPQANPSRVPWLGLAATMMAGLALLLAEPVVPEAPHAPFVHEELQPEAEVGPAKPVRLTVTGDRNADVYLDDNRIGSPPIVGMTLPPGPHRLTIKTTTEIRNLLLESEPGDSIRYHVR